MNRTLRLLFVCLLQAVWVVASAYNLKVEATPQGACSLNTSGGDYDEGSRVYLRTYGNTGYVFKGWYTGDDLVSSSASFYYTMPAEDVVMQARYEYDPTVPADPAMPDTTMYYSLHVGMAPTGAGSLNTSGGKYAEGTSVSLRAYVNTGYHFTGWTDESGETLSASTSFTYVMPRRDAQLMANYYYDPSVPANPDSMATRYRVQVKCKPVGGGTFNTSSTTDLEGNTVHLYAYTNTGYYFKHWEDSEGQVLSMAQNFYYTIPHGNSVVYGVFEYDPPVPSNPAKNYWNKQLGEVIIDDFTTGRLGDAVSSVISGSSRDEVAMITVVGKMNDNDFGIANNYTNCTLLDLSRVTGVTAVPSYAFDYTNLESVYLPASIETIGYRAFYECKQLSSLTVYAMVPPTVEKYAFSGIPDGLIVYVPASSISQYQEAEGWKNFTFLPIQEDICSVTISLPEGTDASVYAQMWLELINRKSGQKMHFVMTDRSSYTFANIIRNTSWNAVVRNQRGDVFGKIDGIDVGDEDVTAVFESLYAPQNITLTVKDSVGNNVTADTQITWMDAEGNYLAQSSAINGLLPGNKLGYNIVLSQNLAMAYSAPSQTEYTVADNNNNIVCTLSPLQKVVISGKVIDLTTKSAVSGAVVSASQTFGGKYSKTTNVKTNNKGEYSIEVFRVPTSLAIGASDYVSQTIECDVVNAEGDNVSVSDVLLKSITGAVISLGFTYTKTPDNEDEEGSVESYYSDYNNVDYTIFNKTQNRSIGQFNVQYPQIVLLEEVNENDVLELTASSRTSAFVPVKTTATIDAEQRASATFNIVGLGKLRSTFAVNGNASVVGSLYDAKGKLIKTYDYSGGSLAVSDLADGTYTLVTMGSSRLFNTIYDLSQLPQTGLAKDVDYVQNSVKIESGKLTVVSIAEVPTLDESKLYYTGTNTSFTVNKSSVVAGNYLTLTGHLDFKPAYSTKVSNVNLIVDLPESCSFVENSVMVGNSTNRYILQGKRVFIPMARYTDRVRFCIIPTLGGDYAPSAFVQFDIDGETITQPIGSANYTAEDLSIKVPSVVAKTTLPVSGTAIGTSSIEIYDGDVLIGQTTSMANGIWTAVCELYEAENLSTHNIYAKVTTKQGLKLQSETIACLYDQDAVMVNTVTMINTAHTSSNLNLYDYVTVFDFQNPQTSIPAYWYWPSYPDFTFLIDLSYHDVKLIPFVWLHVFTSDGNVRSLRADYNTAKDRWVATDKFTSEALPTRVSVTVENMVFDPSTEATYEILMDKFIGDINLKDYEEDENGQTTYNYTDGNGDDIASVTSFETDQTEDELVDSLKQIGFEEDALLNDDSDYTPEDEDDVLEKDVKVMVDKKSGSLAFYRAVLPKKYEVVIVRVIREEGKQSKTELVSSTITKEWKRFHRQYLDEKRCQLIKEYKKYTEHLDKYVTVTTSSLVATLVFVDYRKLPAGTKIPRKQVLAKLRRTRHSSKRYTTWTIEYTVVPKQCPPPPPPPPTSPTPPAPYVLDPSGYVYEGVSSNRLEGVTATAYYKEMVEDMYGDKHENVVKWDATEYAQENPLFTDEYGMYAWDVPQGLWQVKFEKEGYETTYSEWLPVPPPQLDINIAMKQNVQPTVKSARAFEDAVEMEFDKYMMPELLTADNIRVMAGETAVEGTVELLNEEVSYEGNEEKYASKVRFNAAAPFDATEITLMVSNRVKSYAGIRMQDDFSQTFTIEPEMREILCDAEASIVYGETGELNVQVLPAVASAGKTLKVKSSSAMILSTDVEQLTLDKEGKASLTIGGELPGTAAITYSVDGYDLNATTMVTIEQDRLIPENPTASVASGSALLKGTGVTLYCPTSSATIYYTTDGSCPCDAGAMEYDGTPITVSEGMTLKVMAVGKKGDESDIVTYTYTICKTDLEIPLVKGWNWVSHNRYSDLAADELMQDHVERVQTQMGEIYRDSKLGFTGHIDDVSANDGIKVYMSAEGSIKLDGDLFNPYVQPLSLKKGWNWIGYSLDKPVAIDNALADMEPEVGDYIVNITEGFSQYDGEKWIGTLEEMAPGLGYLMKSESDKEFVYNPSGVVTVNATLSKATDMAELPWSVDARKYSNVMCVTGELYVVGQKSDNGQYVVSAFVDGECRGIGQNIDGKIFLSVHGDKKAVVSFLAFDTESGTVYDVDENLEFEADVIGSVSAPFSFHLGGVTAIRSVENDKSRPKAVFNILGQKVKSIDRGGVYVIDGEKVVVTKKNEHEFVK